MYGDHDVEVETVEKREGREKSNVVKDGAKSTNGRAAQWATKEKEPLANDVDPPLQPPHANVDVVHGSEHVEARTRTATDHKMWR